VHDVELPVEVDIFPVPCQYVYPLMNFSVTNDKNVFKQIYLYIVLVQGISTIFTDQMPAFHVSRKVYHVLALEFSVV
jgi:hypothetical protein